MVGGGYFLASVVLFFVLVGAYIAVSLWKRPGLQADAIGLTSVIGAAFGAPPAVRVLNAARREEDLGVLSGLGPRIYLIIGSTLVLLGALLAVYQVFRVAWRGGPKDPQRKKRNNGQEKDRESS
jgi:hypothetical protein